MFPPKQSGQGKGGYSMKRIALTVLGLLIAGAFVPVSATPRGPSTLRERLLAVRYAHSLEVHPLSLDSVQKRQWMNDFLVRVPDIEINVCDNVIAAPLNQANQNYSQQLKWQYVYSSAAFMIQHPEVKNPVKIQTAGVEGALRAYRSILRIDPSVRFTFMEDLLMKRQRGALEVYVKDAISGCPQKTHSAAQAGADSFE